MDVSKSSGPGCRGGHRAGYTFPGEDPRFTVRPDRAVRIRSLTRPGTTPTVEAPVPSRGGDRVTVLGHGPPLIWTVSKERW